MIKNRTLFISLFISLFLLIKGASLGPDSSSPDRISYGTLYIENKTDFDMKVTAKVKDEWDVVTPTNWEVPARGAEKIDNIYKLRDIRFKPDIDDDSVAADWLKRDTILQLIPHVAANDLIVTISKDPYANKWRIEQLYVSSAKIEFGGATGYHVKVLSR
jgi:hypothetical protein